MLKVAGGGGGGGGSSGAVTYQGTWNASTNTPTLQSSVGTQGYYYVVSVAGNTDLNGYTLWNVGDWAVFNGLIWERIPGSQSESFVDLTVTSNLTTNSLTGYMKGNNTSPITASTTIPNTDITGLGTMSTQNATSVVITGGTINNTSLLNTSLTGTKTVTLTGYLYGNNTSANLSASTTIPNSAITGLGTMSTQNASSVVITGGTINSTTETNGTYTNANVTSVAVAFPNTFLANSAVTIGNTSVSLGGTATSIGNLTLSNVTITSGNGTFTNLSSSNATITGGTQSNSTYTNANITSVAVTFPNSYLTNSAVTIGNTAVSLGGTLTTLSNVTIITSAGTSAVAPLVFTAGTVLTTPVAGAIEFDGSTFFSTDDVTDGRGFIPSTHFFRLTSDGSLITTIANFFGATSGMSLDAGIFYEVEAYLYFTKTTAGTATFTMTFSQAPVNNNANYVGTPVGGVGTAGTAQTAAIVKSTATAGALPATGSLTTAVNHEYVLRAMFQANATTGGTLNLQITAGAGSVTPLTGSYYKITRLPAVNTGAFV